MSDILYYEVLDIPLPELQGLKTLKVAFHVATKDEVRFLVIYCFCCFCKKIGAYDICALFLDRDS